MRTRKTVNQLKMKSISIMAHQIVKLKHLRLLPKKMAPLIPDQRSCLKRQAIKNSPQSKVLNWLKKKHLTNRLQSIAVTMLHYLRSMNQKALKIALINPSQMMISNWLSLNLVILPKKVGTMNQGIAKSLRLLRLILSQTKEGLIELRKDLLNYQPKKAVNIVHWKPNLSLNYIKTVSLKQMHWQKQALKH